MKSPTLYSTGINLFIVFIIPLFFSCGSDKTDTRASNDPNQEEWIALWDGQNFNDWTPKFANHEVGINYNNRVQHIDSLLSIRYEPQDTFHGNFGHIFYKDKFSHYRLKATYRFVGKQQANGPGWAFRNNGLMLHCQSPQSMGLPQDFPVCLELQLLGGNGKEERSTANLCTPGTNVVMHDSLFSPHCVNSSSPTFHGDQWVDVEVLVLGDSLFQHIVDGKVVMEYSKPTFGGGAVAGLDESLYKEGNLISEGYISVQAETHPTDFKSISLLNLCGCKDPKAKNYKVYFVKDDPKSCVY
jgi:hypothetical protein